MTDSDVRIRGYVPGPAAVCQVPCLPCAGGSAPFRRRVAQAPRPRVGVLAAGLRGPIGTARRIDGGQEPPHTVLPTVGDNRQATGTTRRRTGEPRPSSPAPAPAGDGAPKAGIATVRAPGAHPGGAFEPKTRRGGPLVPLDHAAA